ncbi:ATP-dependent RecD-like DNA helicase [Mycoplasmopsis hyopharyngis]|uniref:ATP-dependent DNA helicase n=1 Tax=Mycoplasmopsis hyopharyngis TaxID=29558 RepID=UPI0038737B2D
MDKIDNKIKYTGKFSRILSGGAPTWKYTVALFRTENYSQIKIFFTDLEINFNDTYEITVFLKENSKYPDTYYLDELKIVKPQTNDELCKLLQNLKIGIGQKTIEKIEKQTNKAVIDLIREDKEAFLNFFAHSSNKEKIHNFIEDFLNDDMSFFVENKLTSLYKRLCKIFPVRENFVEKFKQENPYNLYLKYNVPFDLVDEFALKLDDENTLYGFNRSEAVVIFSFNELWMNNSTLLGINEIKNIYKRKYPKFSDDLFIKTIKDMITRKLIIFSEEERLLTLTSIFEKEEYILKRLKQLSEKKVINNKKSNIQELSLLQRQAFENAINKPVSIISGFPGTGKTHLVKYIYDELLLEYKSSQIEILTPTGRAATILSSKINVNARTIHSFLKISDEDEGILSVYNSNSPDTKVLIIDEFSMVNVNIFYLLLTTCQNLEKIIIVGDYNQLPCIGPGNILQDLCDSKMFSTTFLTENFRTENPDLVEHYLSILNQQIPNFQANSVKNFNVIPESFIPKIKNIYYQLIQEYSVDDIIVLIPTYKGNKGIFAVNSAIQQMLMQNQKPIFEINFKDIKINYYLGDKIIQLKNISEKNVFNGEIGYIVSFEKNIFTIEFPNNKFIEYTKEEFREYISLAYAVTVHKFQGSESKAVILPIYKDFEFMLTRKLLYTAVSRAKDQLILLGDMSVYMYQIVYGQNENKILTNLQNLIIKLKCKENS